MKKIYFILLTMFFVNISFARNDLTIDIDGEPVNATLMAVTPPGDNQFFNVAAAVFLDVPAGCCSNISVKNNSAIAIDVANANLIVERVA